jgi:hypothetical protein
MPQFTWLVTFYLETYFLRIVFSLTTLIPKVTGPVTWHCEIDPLKYLLPGVAHVPAEDPISFYCEIDPLIYFPPCMINALANMLGYLVM